MSASTVDGRTRLHAADANPAPAAVAFTQANPSPTPASPATAATRAGTRGTSRHSTAATSAGAKTSPATSLSLPVTVPGYAAFSK
ncbi:hypothetical protein GCM10027610_028290 [Dactylosporangium cerinum]